MYKYANFFVMLSLLLFCFSNETKAEEILIWDDCVKEAKQNNPDLISAEEKLNQAKANKAIAKSKYLPRISSGMSGRRSETDTSDRTDTYSYDITGRQLLFDGFKTSYDIASAAENVKSAQYSYEVTSSNVRLRLRTAFVRLLAAQDLLNITEDIAGRRNKNVELVKLRYEAGRENKGALLTTQADLSQAEFEVVRAGRNIDLARRRLTVELGRTQLTPIIVKGDFEIKHPKRKKPDLELLSETNPFLHELIARKESARLGLKSAKADFFPEVYANTSAGRSDSDWPPRRDAWSAGVSLSFPIFEGGSRTAQVSRNKAVLNQRAADEKSGRDGVILTLEEAWKELQDGIDQVGIRQKFLEAGSERAKIGQAKYAAGLVSFDNWIIIEDDLVKAQKYFLDAQAAALIAEANWAQAKGEILDEK